jgi:glycosyltransferase involved in cell wall biosynthesis
MSCSLVTVAIPTYKRPQKFRRALESVLSQSESPDHIIVGDDGNDSEVKEICLAYRDRRIVYEAHRSKQRMTENWDFVMRWASEGLVALLEDDNIWQPDHLANAKRLFSRFPDAGIYHAGHQEAWDDCGELEIYKTFFPAWHARLASAGGGLVAADEVVLDAMLGGSINSSTVVVRRKVLDNVPPFDPRYLMGMDTLMWSRIAMASPCIYGPSLDAIYTYHGGNVSTEEVKRRRAGKQNRASRRLLLVEALRQRIVSDEQIVSFVYNLSPYQQAGMVTMLAHSETAPPLRALARKVWRDRPDIRNTTGFLRASKYTGFWILKQADQVDVLLGLANRLKQRLVG